MGEPDRDIHPPENDLVSSFPRLGRKLGNSGENDETRVETAWKPVDYKALALQVLRRSKDGNSQETSVKPGSFHDTETDMRKSPESFHRSTLVSSPAPILSVVIPQANPGPVAVEAATANPAPVSELERLVGTYRALFRRLDSRDLRMPLGEASIRLMELGDRIRRISPDFDLMAVQLEEGAALMTEPLPPATTPPAGACRTCGGLERWRSVRYREPWKCGRCHPPANPAAVERERLEVEVEATAWDPETAWLIAWLAIAPVPSEPFVLSGALRVSDPARLVEGLRADIAHGPRGPRARTGALRVALEDLWRVVNGEAAGARPGLEE